MSRLLAVLGALVACGCGVQVREARALQPNPLATQHAPGQLAASVPLHIYQGHYLLPGYRFRHWAQFVAVSRDRLRFHIGILGYNEGDADTREWKVWLEDDGGAKHVCDREVPRMNRFTAYDHPVYEGLADYVVHDHDLISRDRRRLTLVVRRDGTEYRYTWTFGQGYEIHDYGSRRGRRVIPGPRSVVEGTTYEDGR